MDQYLKVCGRFRHYFVSWKTCISVQFIKVRNCMCPFRSQELMMQFYILSDGQNEVDSGLNNLLL